jgi:hypothetical protein
MAWRRPLLWVILCASLPVERAAAGVLTGNCRTAEQPAATLLVPYFQVNLDDANGAGTLISVNNASARPALARVTLWTDWGVPTLAFDVYLTGYDVQSLNLRDLFHGNVPATGADLSPRGALSQTAADFPGCNLSAPPGRSSVRLRATLDATATAYLRAAHTGRPIAAGEPPQCAGSGRAGAAVATGYVTVDAVNRCTPPSVGTIENTPAHALYFAAGGTGLASDANVLWGDYIYVNPAEATAASQSAIPLVADPDFFAPGDYTFYGRYVGFDARDDRAPLSSLYYTRYLNGGAFSGGTDLVVWRDNRDPQAVPRSCATGPAWSPPGELQMVAFDEEENPTEIRPSNAFPVAAQLVHVGSPALAPSAEFGWLMIDLWYRDATHAQGWVGVMMSARGRYNTSHPALRADDLCNFGL